MILFNLVRGHPLDFSCQPTVRIFSQLNGQEYNYVVQLKRYCVLVSVVIVTLSRNSHPSGSSAYTSTRPGFRPGNHSALGRSDFTVDVNDFLRGLRLNDYNEIPVKSEHAIAQMHLPMLHKDPFDRMLIAQVAVENVCLLTAIPMYCVTKGR